MSEEKKQKRHLQEKICLNYRKFHNFTRENSLNQNSNDTDKCRIQWCIQRYSSEHSNRSENRRKKRHLGGQICQNDKKFDKIKFTQFELK